MGRRRGGRAERTGRPVMRSPGRPPVGRREHRQRFWAAIARGERSDVAGVGGGRVAGRWASGGFGRLAGCRRSVRLRCRGGTCRSPSARRSRCCAPVAVGCARSRGGWVARRRRSRGSCGATPRRAAAAWSIGRQRRSGMPTGAPSAPSRPSWRSTSGCVAMCRSGWLAACSVPTASRSAGRRSRGSAGAVAAAGIGAGRGRGARSRSPTGCAWTSPMMSRCGSRPRRSISRCMSRAAARSSAS